MKNNPLVCEEKIYETPKDLTYDGITFVLVEDQLIGLWGNYNSNIIVDNEISKLLILDLESFDSKKTYTAPSQEWIDSKSLSTKYNPSLKVIYNENVKILDFVRNNWHYFIYLITAFVLLYGCVKLGKFIKDKIQAFLSPYILEHIEACMEDQDIVVLEHSVCEFDQSFD